MPDQQQMPNQPAPAAAAKQPAATDPNAAMMAYITGQGPRPATTQYGALAATGRYDPAQLAQVMTPAAPPAGGAAAAPAKPAIAVAPGTMPPPLGYMPQLFNPGDNMPVNVQMQQLPNGQSVDASQAGAAKHMLGMDRLPDFKTYLQQQRLGNTLLPGSGDPQMILKQYLALQGVQSQGDQDATGRMGTAGNLGVAQGGLALQQQKQQYEQGQGVQDAAKLAVLQGGMANPNGTPEALNNGMRNATRFFPGAAQPGAAQPGAATIALPSAGSPATANPIGAMTGSEQLLGPDLAAKIASEPQLKGATPRAKFDYIAAQKGPAWVQQNFPALQSYLAEGTPGAADELRASAHPSMAENVLKSPFQLLGSVLRTSPNAASLWSQQGRQKFAEAQDTPFDEQLSNFAGRPPTAAQNNSALLRALMP